MNIEHRTSNGKKKQLTADTRRQRRTTCPAFDGRTLRARTRCFRYQSTPLDGHTHVLFSRSEWHIYPARSAGWGLRLSSERSEGAVNPDLFLLAVISRLKPYMVFCIPWFDPPIHYPSPMVLEKVRFILMSQVF